MSALPLISTNNLAEQASTVFEVSSSSFESDPLPKVEVVFPHPLYYQYLRFLNPLLFPLHQNCPNTVTGPVQLHHTAQCQGRNACSPNSAVHIDKLRITFSTLFITEKQTETFK